LKQEAPVKKRIKMTGGKKEEARYLKERFFDGKEADKKK